MIFYIHQRVFSFADKYDIFDEHEQPVYHVEAEVFSWGPKVYVYDLNGRELFYIKGKVFSLVPEYTIFRDERACAVVRGRFSFRPKIDISSVLGKIYIEGNFIAHNFFIYQNQEIIGTIDKPYFTWGDKYQLVIPDDYPDPAFVCALVITIDNCIHNES